MRSTSTYRGDRRNAWRATAPLVRWAEFNQPSRSERDLFGSAKPGEVYHGKAHIDRSRYDPHIGAKERARHAGKPDGAMHVTGWERRAALLAEIAADDLKYGRKREAALPIAA